MDNKEEQQTSFTASDLDAVRHFVSNQGRWNAFSTQVIHDVAAQGPGSFQQVFRELASKRHEIAEELKQAENDGANDFGIFRSEDYKCWENFFKGGKGGYSVQGEKVNALVDALFSLESVPQNCEKDDFEQQKTTDREGNPVEIRVLHIMTPYAESELEKTNTKLTQIIWPNNNENSYVRLDYDYVNKHSIQRTYAVLDVLWQKLSNIEPCNDHSEFLKTAGKICYIMAHVLPLKRGTSAVVDWMIRGQAEKNGIILGQYSQDKNELSWPIKALVSAGMGLEEYANWYKNNAFTSLAVKHTASKESEKENIVNNKRAQRKSMLANTNAYSPEYFKSKSERKNDKKEDLAHSKPKSTR